MSQFATAQELRDFMGINANTGRASTTNLDNLLQSASDFLERRTGRLITSSGSNTVKTFSSDGRDAIVIPDLRVVSSITLQTSPLVADQTYWLLPSRQQPAGLTETIYTGLQLRPFGSYDYRSNPQWFDRNLDSPYWTFRRYGLPNDLIVSALWGWSSTPPEWKNATLTLAGYYYKRPDSLLANVAITPEGNQLDYSQLPPEVGTLIEGWRNQDQAVSL